MKVCSKCGKEKPLEDFWRDSTRSDGRHGYCKECRWQGKKKRTGEWAVVKKQCKHCMIIFERKPSTKHGEKIVGDYCSPYCYRLATKNEQINSCVVYFKECSICGHAFTARISRAHLCSDECRSEYARKKTLERDKKRKVVRNIKCKKCGKVFTNVYGIKNRVFCSTDCLDSFVSDSDRLKRKIQNKKRRAITRGAKAENVNPVKVFMRDMWVCQLCGKRTLKRKRGTTDSRAPELDHIVPLSKGGDHSYRNTQCTCRECNNRKGSDLMGQLRMF